VEGIWERRPFGRESLFKQIGPLTGAVMLWLLSVTSLDISHRPAVVAQGASLVVLAVLATVALPWHRLPDALKVVPPLMVALVGVRLQVLLDAGLWSDSAFLLLPMFWLAAFGTRTEVWAGVAVVAAGLFGQALIWSHPGAGWAEAAVLTAATAVAGMAIRALFRRIRSRAARHPALQATDALTGLPARQGWEARLPQLLTLAAATRQPVCVLAVHIDRFRAYGDEHGRRDAERLLRGAAALWRDRLRKTDLLARVDGGEFAALLVGCSVEAAAGIAGRLSTVLDEPVTFSLGIAEWNGEESAAALTRRAQVALERAKRAGGDRIEFGTSRSGKGDGRSMKWPAPANPAPTSPASSTP
jgi:diguanylate cyclase (GGDEF)-like protein